MTTLFGDTAITTLAPIDAPVARKKLGWLPLLTVLFMVSYGLMTMLIVEQGSTIESQRALIRELFRDSTELTASKMKSQREKNAAHGQAPSAKSQAPTNQAPSFQNPSTQANQAPSSQAVPQRPAPKTSDKARPFQMPSRPAADLADERRALITI
ncbi:MAG TPA: hypothetical protein VMR80_04995 [Candidatus Acidoferrum sp.]|nr:hypothetical protein [Candidatus Acidoferrum sp.]